MNVMMIERVLAASGLSSEVGNVPWFRSATEASFVFTGYSVLPRYSCSSKLKFAHNQIQSLYWATRAQFKRMERSVINVVKAQRARVIFFSRTNRQHRPEVSAIRWHYRIVSAASHKMRRGRIKSETEKSRVWCTMGMWMMYVLCCRVSVWVVRAIDDLLLCLVTEREEIWDESRISFAFFRSFFLWLRSLLADNIPSGQTSKRCVSRIDKTFSFSFALHSIRFSSIIFVFVSFCSPAMQREKQRFC